MQVVVTPFWYLYMHKSSHRHYNNTEKKETCAEIQWQVNYIPSKGVFALLLAEGPPLFSHLLFCDRAVSITDAKTQAPVGCR